MAPRPVREQPRQAAVEEKVIYKPSEVDTGRQRIGDPKSLQQKESNFLTEDDANYRGPLKKHSGKHLIQKQYGELIGGVLSGYGSSVILRMRAMQLGKFCRDTGGMQSIYILLTYTERFHELLCLLAGRLLIATK